MGLGIPGFESGGDMSFDTGAGGNDSLGSGDKIGVGGDKNSGGFGSSTNNVNFQFKLNDAGNSALDMASGFFKTTQPKTETVVQVESKKWVVAGAVAVALIIVVGAVLIKGRK